MAEVVNLRTVRKRAKRQQHDHVPTPIVLPMASPNILASSKPRTKPKPAATSIGTGSK